MIRRCQSLAAALIDDRWIYAMAICRHDKQKTASEMYEGECQLVEWLLSSNLVFRGQLHELSLMAMKAANVKRVKPMTPISLQRNNFALDFELSAVLAGVFCGLRPSSILRDGW
jgi:hypothetical protein